MRRVTAEQTEPLAAGVSEDQGEGSHLHGGFGRAFRNHRHVDRESPDQLQQEGAILCGDECS
jgi:hypothetical protein